MDHHRARLGFSGPEDSDLDLVRFDHGCLMLGISLRTAFSRLKDENSDMPRPFSISNGRQRFFRRSDLVAYVARKAEEAQRLPSRPSPEVIAARQTTFARMNADRAAEAMVERDRASEAAHKQAQRDWMARRRHGGGDAA